MQRSVSVWQMEDWKELNNERNIMVMKQNKEKKKITNKIIITIIS